MAFKTLSSQELELLSDEQREQYEKELDMFQQRAAFVAQLEREENIQLESYKIIPQAIPAVETVQVKAYEDKEYVVSQMEPQKKAVLKVKEFEEVLQKSPHLPAVSTPHGVLAEYTENEEGVQIDLPSVKKPTARVSDIEISLGTLSDLPKIAKPKSNVQSFQYEEKEPSQLPHVLKPSFQTMVFFDQENNIQFGGLKDMPQMQKPGLEMESFEIPEGMSAKVPEVSLDLPLIRKYSLSDKTAEATLPSVPEIAVVNVSYHEQVQKEAELPQLKRPSIHVQDYNDTWEMSPALPSVSKLEGTSVPSVEFDKPQILIPETVKASLDLKTFALQKSEAAQAELPQNMGVSQVLKDMKRLAEFKPDIPMNTKDIKRPANPKPELPKIKSIDLDMKEMQLQANPKPELPKIESIHLNIKEMQLRSNPKPELPDISGSYFSMGEVAAFKSVQPSMAEVHIQGINSAQFSNPELKISELPKQESMPCPDVRELMKELLPDLYKELEFERIRE